MKIGILGTGRIAGAMADTIPFVPHAEGYAAASRELSKAEKFADAHGFSRAYGSYEELLADPFVELVYVAVPHAFHYRYAKMALEAGKHVLCEKAFTINAAQAERLLALSEEKGLFLAEALWTRYMPSCQILQSAVQSGVIGEVSSLCATLGYASSGVPRMHRPDLGGGALLDLGVYALSFAFSLFGSEPLEIQTSCTKLDTGVDSQDMIALTFEGGKTATLFASILGLTERRGMIYGSRGYLQVENISNPWRIAAYDLQRQLIREYEIPEQKTGYEYELAEVIRAIEEGKTETEKMPQEETLRLMKCMDALRRRWDLSYPPETEAL